MNYTKLIVRDLSVAMPIGIFEHDKNSTEPLLINIEADVRLPENWQADEYKQILGYDKIVGMVHEVTGAGHLNLVETLAAQLAVRCFGWDQVETVKIRVEKPKMYPDCVVGVEICRTRG